MTPLLIHQMGRVGSTSIYNAVNDLPQYDVYHTHMLNKQRLDEFCEMREKKKLKLPNHVADSRKVIAEFLEKDRPVKIVSLVRDPMARNISAFFNNLDGFGFRSVKSRQEVTADKLLSVYKQYDHRIPIRWFSHEFRDVFGFSVFGTPFDFEKKSLTIYRKNVSLLVLRLEDDDEKKISALEKFLGVTGLTLSKDNAGGSKFGEAFEDFKHLFKPDEEFVDSVYNTKLVRHFYTDEEIAAMKSRWIR